MISAGWRQAFRLLQAHPSRTSMGVSTYAGFFIIGHEGFVLGLLAKVFFDRLAGQVEAGPNLWTLVALIVGLELAGLGLLYQAARTFQTFGYRAEGLLKQNMMNWLAVAPGSPALIGSSGEMVSRFRDDTAELAWFSPVLLTSPQVLTALIAFGIMLSIDAPTTLFVLTPLAGVVWTVQLLSRRVQSRRQAVRETTASVTGFLGEAFSAVQALKLSGAEARIGARLDDLGGRRERAAISDLVLASILQSINANLVAFGSALVLLVSAAAMRRGDFSVGDFVLFVSYLRLTLALPQFVGQVLAREKQAGVSVQRMQALAPPAAASNLTRRPTLTGSGPSSPVGPLKSFTASKLAFRYPDGSRGLDDLDLEVTGGTLTVVAGPVGSGKTTLVRVLLGLLPAQAGYITWNGARVAEPSTFMVPPRVAYTAQAPRLFSDDVLENISMGWPASSEDLWNAVRLAVFDDDIGRLDQGLATRVGTRGVTLSGGQVQRCALARMLIRDPDLLVMDDASSALDGDTERRLWRGLLTSKRRTVLAVSNRRFLLEKADQILLLGEGRLIGRGRFSDLRTTSPEFCDLIGC